MKTSEVAFQIYGCGHTLETPVDLAHDLLALGVVREDLHGHHAHVQLDASEAHALLPVKELRERRGEVREAQNKVVAAHLYEVFSVHRARCGPRAARRACTLRPVCFSYPDYTKECFFVVRRVFSNKQNSYLYFDNLLHLRFHLTATNSMPFDNWANAEWPAVHHHRGL